MKTTTQKAVWTVPIHSIYIHPHIQEIRKTGFSQDKRAELLTMTRPLELNPTLARMRDILFRLTEGTPSKMTICALVEFLAGLDYARTPHVAQLKAIESVYKKENQHYVTHFVQKLQKFDAKDLNCWFRMRALTMDIYATLVIANTKSQLIFFYGGSNHTQNVARALKSTESYTVHTHVHTTKGGFELEILTNPESQRVICLGEDHFKTDMSYANRLIKWLKKRCKGPSCTFLVEKHLKFIHEDADSFPNEMACDSTDRLAIQKARCHPMMQNSPCQNVDIKFVDNRHCDLGFFRGPEISKAAHESREFKSAYINFQQRALQDLTQKLSNLN